MIAVIGGAEENAFLIGWLQLWAAPIRLDPNWNQGDYYGRAEPTRGLIEALKIVTLQASQWPWVDRMFGRAWAEEGKDPAAAMENRFAVEAWLERTAAARAAACDANHFLYLVKANQLFLTGHGPTLEAGLAAIKAPCLLIASANDLVFPPTRHLRALKDKLAALGKDVDVHGGDHDRPRPPRRHRLHRQGRRAIAQFLADSSDGSNEASPADPGGTACAAEPEPRR